MILRRIDVPDYIYKGRVGEGLLNAFEDQYYRRVKYYDDALMESDDAKLMARRIGYSYIDELREKLTTRQQAGHVPALSFKSLGDDGFAWRFLPEFIGPQSVAYCFGLGTNMTFEDTLARDTGAEVHCFDPTEQAVNYARPIVAANDRLTLHEVGLSNADTTLRFYRNPEPGIGSLSIKNLGYGDNFVEFEVKTLETLMRERGHTRLDLLKFDIEGAEYDVISDLAKHGTEVDQICLEFDQPVPPWTTADAIETLSQLGYVPISIWGLNFLFVHQRLLDMPRYASVTKRQKIYRRQKWGTCMQFDRQTALNHFEAIEGMMGIHAARMFLFLLEYQAAQSVRGPIIETGVYKGKSAALLCRY